MGNLYSVAETASLNNFEKTYNKFISAKTQYSTYNLIKNNRFQSKYENIIPHWQLLQDLNYELVDGLKITGNVDAGEFLKQETQRKIFSDKYYTFYIRVKNPNSNFYIEIEYPENDVVNVDDLTATTKTVINLDDVDGLKEYRAYFKTSDSDNIDKISITFCSKNNVTLSKEFIIQEVSFYEGYLDTTGITNESLFDLSVEYDDYQKYWKLTNNGKDYFRLLVDDGYIDTKLHTIVNTSIENIKPIDLLIKIKQIDGSGSGLDADLLDGKDSNYFFQLNEYAIPSNWNPKSDWQKVGGFTINHDYGKDTYIALDNGEGRKVHLVIDGDVYANEGTKRLAYDDLSNVSKQTIKNKLGFAGEINLSGSDLFWHQDSDSALITFNHYGTNKNWLTFVFSDDEDDRISIKFVPSSICLGGNYPCLKNPNNWENVIDILPTKISSFVDILPNFDNNIDLGKNNLRFKNAFVNNIYSKNLQIENADLAEKYTCKDEVEPGDIVQVSTNFDYEIEKCNEIASLKIVGVVSESPAILLNKEENGIPIALKGKVKCKVLGPIRKGEPIISYKNGIGISYYNPILNEFYPVKFVGVALENIEKDEIKKILIIL